MSWPRSAYARRSLSSKLLFRPHVDGKFNKERAILLYRYQEKQEMSFKRCFE